MPAFITHGKLSYDYCATLYASARNKDKGKPIAKNGAYYIRHKDWRHPLSGEVETVYTLQMYSTDILVFWRDGTIRVDGYDSITTNSVLSQLGPCHVFNRSDFPAQCKHRFGGWKEHWPMGNDIVVRADGTVHGLVDTFRRVKTEAKPERRRIRQDFFKYGLPRVLLGEFGTAFAMRSADGWKAYAPYQIKDRDNLVRLLIRQADHAEIHACLQSQEQVCKKAFGRTPWRSDDYPSEHAAVMAAMNSILRTFLADGYYSDQYEDYTVAYPPVRVRG